MINILLKLIILPKRPGWRTGNPNLMKYGKICLMVTYLKAMSGTTFYWITLLIKELPIFSMMKYSISIWDILWDSSIWMGYLSLKLQIKLLMGIKILWSPILFNQSKFIKEGIHQKIICGQWLHLIKMWILDIYMGKTIQKKKMMTIYLQISMHYGKEKDI